MRLWDYRLLKVLPNKMLVSQWRECDSVKITFFGGNKQIAEISSLSSSGSGWSYGACVTVKCKELNIDEIITQW